MAFSVFSDEIVLLVLSYPDVLTTEDIYNVMLTCKRLYRVGIPLLYRTTQFNSPNIARPPHLSNLLRMIDLEPRRGSWVQLASVGWPGNHEKMWSKTFELVSIFHSPQSIEFHVMSWREDKDLNFARFLGECTNTSLRTVTVEDHNLRIKDIVAFYALPNLIHFRVINFCADESDSIVYNSQSTFVLTKLQKLEFLNSSFPITPQASLLSQHPVLTEFAWIINPNGWWSNAWDEDILSALTTPFASLYKSAFKHHILGVPKRCHQREP
ncbi:uncharacterized protein LY89DRAFT_251059 [Mollisia scopiformis]|uniref:Uncharacterized protein n=1 Tax=Mollisia scopiformis TaxID=149040 RepID=A0A194WS56_MOLSC|nr:uncharacterized protein LY89DRAFT_251059 [Mollisia scopiformis]KUJ10801.1 hypothetical protein LY89DRAFT_251059 [Mollisia scopiformis]